jgi:hypothetical protein
MDEAKQIKSWTCSHCGENLESQFEVCWNCGTSNEGELNPEFESYREIAPKHPPIESTGYIYKTLGVGFLLYLILYLGIDTPADYTTHYYEPDLSVFWGLLAVIAVILLIVFLGILFYLVVRKQDAPPDEFRLLSGLSLDEQISCPHCLTINHPLSYFCITCMTPLTTHACIDPLYRIYAQGNTYQKAAAKPTNFLVALGMWLIFGLQIPIMIWVFFESLSEAEITRDAYPIGYVPSLSATLPELLSKCFGLILAGVMILLYTAITVKVTRKYYHSRNHVNGVTSKK